MSTASKHLLERLAASTATLDHIRARSLGVMVACSAGIDSTALFHALRRFSQSGPSALRLAVCHVNYGLRGTASDADEAFVRARADDHGLPFHLLRLTAEDRAARHGESLQEWARRLRYGAFARWAAEGWVIALAHHADDLAETVLQRLARGASPASLLGMKAWEPPYWRPLLLEKKATLAAFLEGEKIPHREDETNATLLYGRNVIRHKVLPELEALHAGASDRLVATARDAGELSDWVRTQVRSQIQGRRDDLGALASELPKAVAMVLLTELLAEAGIANRALSRQWLGRVLDHVRRADSAGWALAVPGGGRLCGEGRRLWAEHEPPRGKPARQSQHARALGATRFDVTLEPGSHAFIRHGPRILAIGTDQTHFLSPANVKVYGSSAGKRLRFKGSRRSWTLKDLAERWRIDAAGRPQLLVVELDGEVSALFDGHALVCPAEGGARRQAESANLDIRYVRSQGTARSGASDKDGTFSQEHDDGQATTEAEPADAHHDALRGHPRTVSPRAPHGAPAG